jgi:hypothetical protein
MKSAMRAHLENFGMDPFRRMAHKIPIPKESRFVFVLSHRTARGKFFVEIHNRDKLAITMRRVATQMSVLREHPRTTVGHIR